MESPSTSPHTEHAPMSTIKSSFRAASSRCTQCNARQKENARNLVVCIDGTSNQFGHNVFVPYLCIIFLPLTDYGQNTNVVKLFAKIDLETTHPEQYAYYSSGIGTRPKSLHIFNRMERAVSDKFDMAVAWFVPVTIPLFVGMKYLWQEYGGNCQGCVWLVSTNVSRRGSDIPLWQV